MSWYKPWTWGDDSESKVQQRDNMNETGNQASNFADQSQAGVAGLSAEAAAQRDALRRLASGQDSYSAEELRQGLQRNLSAQRSLAAGAGPQNAAMAARQASLNAARMGSGLVGQQALAGIKERQAAQDALTQAILGQRGQDVQAALGSRGNAINAYGGIKPEGSFLDKYGGAIMGGLGIGFGRGK